MLELRPSCEHCGKNLPQDSTEAMICSFECTYCKECAQEVFQNVCPSCGGGFSPRPIRPKVHLEENPPSTLRVFKPKDLNKHGEMLERYRHLKPEER
ncbi:DUF1272 domain-containing protein [Xanthovirga aplysinae]|uniref:DUF1272 domain-containing protein n=1 Tax=Xanthovirga aplysinae TaxID=2529853 RepID=UPI0012BC96FA|nr:DUF1272 domain-containing protein [Xanthovirga aplysinae]MTI30274.1 DUF1272 domain-containing protein [Xanthovirga aplysinae]